MQLSSDTIVSPALQALLEILRREHLPNIFVVGGAVRDTLLARPIRDIDIAVRLACKAPRSLRTRNWPAMGDGTSELWQELAGLARAVGCKLVALRRAVPFHASRIDVLGLARVEDGKGLRYPDIFVDTDGRLFNACPELTVNQLTLSYDGVVQPEEYVCDLFGRKGRFTAAPSSLRLRHVLRGLKTLSSLALEATPETIQLMTRHLVRLRQWGAVEEELEEADCRRILKTLVTTRVYRAVHRHPRGVLAVLENMLHDIPQEDITTRPKPSLLTRT